MVCFLILRICQHYQLIPWFKHHSFVVMHFVFFSQLRLKEVQNALNLGYSTKQFFSPIYLYFFFTVLSHTLFVFAKQSSGYPAPEKLAKFYVDQLPFVNFLTLPLFPYISSLSHKSYAFFSCLNQGISW